MSERELPAGWETAKIGDLCELVNGKAFKPSDWGLEGLPIIRIQNLNDPSAKFNYFGGEVPEKFLVEPGELLFAWSGTPGTSFGAHVWQGERGVLNQHIFRVLFDGESTDKEFFRLAINHKLDELIGKAQGGVGLRHVTKGTFEETEIVYPPFPEQRRIVEKIEALTARSRRAREALDALPALIDRYRQSILAAAFRGDLTADWRKAHPEAETATAFLARNGVRGEEVDAEDTPVKLPETWCWARLSDVAEVKGGLAKGKKRPAGVTLESVPYLRVANVQRGFLDLSEVKEIEATTEEIEQLRLRTGDILFNEGGDRDKLGRGWVWSGEIGRCIHQNHVFRARLRSAEINPFLISHFGNTFGQKYFFGEGKQSVNLASISLSKLKAFPVPVIPLAEQVVLCARIEEALRRVEVFRAAWRSGSEQLPALDQSILAKAFRGELVPQDPNDEPASVLLERIRAERAAAGDKPRRGRRAARG